MSCDDGLFCNGEATCVGGACTPGVAPCTLGCDESAQQCRTACPPLARLDCRAAGASTLLIKRKASPARDALVWKWLRGEATALVDFGDPRTVTGYALCLYGGDGQLLDDGGLVVDAGSGWQTIGSTGFAYSSASGAQSGVRKLLLRAGASGRASALLKGKGAALPDLPLPIAPLPLTVQLVTSETCWQSVFSATDVRRNDATQVKAVVH